MGEASVWLLMMGVLGIEVALNAGRSAVVNSRQERLADWQEQGLPGAGLALRVAQKATPLLSSLEAGQGLLRLAVLALAAGAAVLRFGAGTPWWVVAASVGMAGLVMAMLDAASQALALRAAEVWAVRLSALVAAATWLFTPLGWIVRRAWSRGEGGARGGSHAVVTEEAIMTMVDAGEEGGVIEEEEKAMIFSIFHLGDTLAREVMVPRIDIQAFEENTTLRQAADALLESGHSRAPVYSGSIDNVIGLLYAKDLLAAWRDGRQEGQVRDLLRPAYFVPEAKKVDELLAEMQANRVHMAIVVDEYGGTAGLVTIEDIVEEILGEIQDEYDVGEELPYTRLPDGSVLFKGQVTIDDVNEVLETSLPEDVSETLGGLVFSRLGHVPAAGETIDVEGVRLTVEQVVGRRIRKVRASRMEGGAAPETDHEDTDASAKG